jgi:hypothetical protein
MIDIGVSSRLRVNPSWPTPKPTQQRASTCRSATGYRVGAARIGQRAAQKSLKGPSSGPSLVSQILAALNRPGVAQTSRPTASDGSTSFHFEIRTSTKGSVFMEVDARSGAAPAHHSYIERKGAAEFVDLDITIAPELSERQGCLEREGAVERAGGRFSSFGNIADKYQDRLEFWQAVEKHENSPLSHRIAIYPSLEPDFWQSVEMAGLASSWPWRQRSLPDRGRRPDRPVPDALRTTAYDDQERAGDQG